MPWSDSDGNLGRCREKYSTCQRSNSDFYSANKKPGRSRVFCLLTVAEITWREQPGQQERPEQREQLQRPEQQEQQERQERQQQREQLQQPGPEPGQVLLLSCHKR